MLRHIARTRVAASLPENERISAELVAGLFPEQRALVLSESRQRLARCGRRAGKTTAVATALVLAALSEPGAQAAYVALTRENAKYLLVPELERLRERHRIPMRINLADLVVTVGDGPSPGVIFLRGTDNERSVDKLRSFYFNLIALDEMAFYGHHVGPLVDSLEATMMDRQGSMIAISSPGYVCAGRFWDIDQPGSGWERHHWTALNNPHIPHAARWLDEMRAKRGWADNDPTYMREYLGRWVEDSRALCYPFDPARNVYEALPHAARWQHVMGIDVGYSPDPAAFTVLAYAMEHLAVYVVHSERHERWTPSQVWAHAQQLERRYRVEAIAVDGSAGEVAELAQRFAIPVSRPLNKHMLATHIEWMADDLRRGRLLLKREHHGLIQEMRTVAWNAERTGPSGSVQDDAADSLRYAWTLARHYAAKPPAPPPTTTEIIDAEEKRLEEQAEAELASQLDDDGAGGV